MWLAEANTYTRRDAMVGMHGCPWWLRYVITLRTLNHTDDCWAFPSHQYYLMLFDIMRCILTDISIGKTSIVFAISWIVWDRFQTGKETIHKMIPQIQDTIIPPMLICEQTQKKASFHPQLSPLELLGGRVLLHGLPQLWPGEIRALWMGGAGRKVTG